MKVQWNQRLVEVAMQNTSIFWFCCFVLLHPKAKSARGAATLDAVRPICTCSARKQREICVKIKVHAPSAHTHSLKQPMIFRSITPQFRKLPFTETHLVIILCKSLKPDLWFVNKYALKILPSCRLFRFLSNKTILHFGDGRYRLYSPTILCLLSSKYSEETSQPKRRS